MPPEITIFSQISLILIFFLAKWLKWGTKAPTTSQASGRAALMNFSEFIYLFHPLSHSEIQSLGRDAEEFCGLLNIQHALPLSKCYIRTIKWSCAFLKICWPFKFFCNLVKFLTIAQLTSQIATQILYFCSQQGPHCFPSWFLQGTFCTCLMVLL